MSFPTNFPDSSNITIKPVGGVPGQNIGKSIDKLTQLTVEKLGINEPSNPLHGRYIRGSSS